MDLPWVDIIRVSAACMLAFVLYNQIFRLRRLRQKFTPALRDLWWVFTASIFVLFHLSLEPILFNEPRAPSHAVLILIIAVVALRVSLRKPQEVFNAEVVSELK